MGFRVITKAMNLYAYQQLFFTTLEYGELRPVFQEAQSVVPLAQLHDYNVLLLAGIASPKQLLHDLTPQVGYVTPLIFADHHQFTHNDVKTINEAFSQLSEPRVIVTTEKDATRLQQVEGLSDLVRTNLFIIPINVCFMLEQGNTFNSYIINYVHKNSRNSILAQAKDDHKPHNRNHSGNGSRAISFRNY